MKIKIEYSKLKKKTREELLEMKDELRIASMNTKLYHGKRDQGLSPTEVRKNLARVNQRLNEIK